MTKRFVTIALCSAALVACGGGDGDRANAATARTFSYSAPVDTFPPTAAADAIESIVTFESAGDASSAVAAQGSLMAIGYEVLGDEPAFGGFAATEMPAALVRDVRARTLRAALTGPGTEFAECTAVRNDANGSTTVEFENCQYSETTTDGTMTVKVAGTVVGSPGAVAWNVTYALSMTAPDWAMTLGYHDVGDIDVTATTLKAHQEADVGLVVSGGGQHAELGFAQAVDLDVTIGTCATGTTSITGGTLEAKRVWTKVPRDYPPEVTVDAGVLYTWTGCGTAEMRSSTR